jgi:uncharacterized protein DUF5825
MSMLRAEAEAAALEAVRLRRLMTAGTIEPWAGQLPDGLDTRPLHHLPPPAGREPGPADSRLEQWRAAFRPGLCYYRRGPGFIQVSDIRTPESGALITISQKSLIDAFLRCKQPVSLTGQAGAAPEVLEILRQEGLLLQFGELVTIAPYHMRCWPIPAQLA